MQRMPDRHDQVGQRQQQDQTEQDAEEDHAATVEGTEDEATHDHDSTARPFSANRPRGRFWMNRMMATSTRILASTAPA